MLPGDDLAAALAQEALCQDERVSQYWDSRRSLGRLVSQALGLTAYFAWDIYLLYTPGETWKAGKIPVPCFWMHQLNERADLRLDPDRLIAEVQKAIG